MSTTKTKENDRLAEAARAIYRNYGNNLQRYFDDLFAKLDNVSSTAPAHADSKCVPIAKNASSRGLSGKP